VWFAWAIWASKQEAKEEAQETPKEPPDALAAD